MSFIKVFHLIMSGLVFVWRWTDINMSRSTCSGPHPPCPQPWTSSVPGHCINCKIIIRLQELRLIIGKVDPCNILFCNFCSHLSAKLDNCARELMAEGDLIYIFFKIYLWSIKVEIIIFHDNFLSSENYLFITDHAELSLKHKTINLFHVNFAKKMQTKESADVAPQTDTMWRSVPQSPAKPTLMITSSSAVTWDQLLMTVEMIFFLTEKRNSLFVPRIPQCKMCSLYSMFFFQLNKLRHISNLCLRYHLTFICPSLFGWKENIIF